MTKITTITIHIKNARLNILNDSNTPVEIKREASFNYKVSLINSETDDIFIDEASFITQITGFSKDATIGILPFSSTLDDNIVEYKERQRSTPWAQIIDGVPERMFDSAPDRSANIIAIKDGEKTAIFAYIDNLSNHWVSIRIEDDNDLVLRFKVNKNIRLKKGESREIGKFIIKFYEDIPAEDAIKDFGKLYFSHIGKKPYKTPEWLLKSPILEFHPSFIGGFKKHKKVEKLTAQLEALRINTIYLMPIWEYTNISGRMWNENWACSGSIYSIKDYYKIDTFLGDFSDLKYFVDTMHKKGIRVLLDLVIQGCSRDSKLPVEHPDWFMRNKDGEMFGSHGWNDTYAFDSTHPAVIEYFLNIVRHYIKEFNVDGFRVDAPAWKEANVAPDYPHDPGYTCFKDVKLLERIYNEVKKIKPGAVVISEDGGPIFYDKCDASYDIYAHWNAFIDEKMTPSLWKEWIRTYFALYPSDMYRLNFNESHDTHYLSPWKKQWRGSLKSRLIMANIVFAGFIPMVWYPEIDENERFFERLFTFRERIAEFLLHSRIDFDIETNDENILVLGRYNDKKKIVYIANFNAEYKGLVVRMPGIVNFTDSEKEYYFYNLWDDAEFEIVRNNNYNITYKNSFKGKELLKDFELWVPPFIPVFLELRLCDEKAR